MGFVIDSDWLCEKGYVRVSGRPKDVHKHAQRFPDRTLVHWQKEKIDGFWFVTATYRKAEEE